VVPSAGPDGVLPVAVVLELLDAAEHADDPGEVSRILAAAALPATSVALVEDAARRLRGGAARWRRRGQELAALYSTARELAELRDVDELLERLVERAHDLVGTDVTYLSEFDVTTRELRVRTTLGAFAPSFRQLRVPAGTGLASLVVESRTPKWTSSYPAMTQAARAPVLDAAVAAEGLVSLLGVPLLAGDEVIGVLFAANRVEHSFGPEEISLLSAFADHAAVVLQTARLLAETRRSDAQTRQAYGELARHVAAMERASGVHEDLTALVLRGGDAADVAAALGRALQCTVTMLDAELRPVAGSTAAPEQAAPDGPAPDDLAAVRDAVARSRRSGRCAFLNTEDAPGRLAVAVVAGSTFLGALLLDQGALGFGPVEQRTVERAAQITALLHLKQDAVIEAEQRVRGDLVADLLSDDPVRVRDVAARARARRVDVERLRCLVVVGVDAEHRRAAARAAERAAGEGGLVGEHANRLVVLTRASAPADAARQVHAAVARALAVPVLAVAAPAEGPLRARFEAAESCLRVLPALGRRDAAVTTDEYLPYAALFGPGAGRVDAFVRSAIGPVLDWDASRGGALLPTLAAYLDNRSSPVATARVLHLHKNTVLQRLDRVAELLGADWQRPDRLFGVTVAVRVGALLGEAG